MSSVKVTSLEPSRVSSTSPVLSLLIAPLNDEPLVRFIVSFEMESTTILPVAF